MGLTYSCEITIDVPRERALALIEDMDNLPKWQPGLLEFRHLSGTPGQVGAKSVMRQKMGRSEVEITETITERDLPEKFTAVYEAKGVWNEVENFWSDTPDGRTRWRVETEFRCRGLTWLMTVLMPGLFRRETEKYMKNFKDFAERTERGTATG